MKVKRLRDEAIFVTHASTTLCVCLCVCVCVCVCEVVHTYQPSAIRPVYYPTRNQVSVRWRGAALQGIGQMVRIACCTATSHPRSLLYAQLPLLPPPQ